MRKFNRYDMRVLHFGTLVLALYCHCGDKKYLPIVLWNKKHLSRQAVPIRCTLCNRLFGVANFEGL